MSKLTNFKSELYSKKAMSKTVGGRMAQSLELADTTKTNCTGLLTSMPDCSLRQDCGDSDGND